MAQWRAGRTIRTAATLRRPAHYLNPGVADDRLALARRGLTLVGSVKSGTLVEVAGARHVAAGARRRPSRARSARALRRMCGRATRRPPPSRRPFSSATAPASIRRSKSGCRLPARITSSRSRAATSPCSPSILLGLARLLRVAAWLGGPLVAVLLVLHAGLVGGGASVARATTMAVIYLGLRAFDQSAWSLNALARGRRRASWSPGPWRSWTPDWCSASAPRPPSSSSRRESGAHRQGSAWRRTALGVVAASLATELVLLPVSATFFNRVTVAGLLLNLAAVPLMAVVQVAASLTVLAHPFAPGAASAFGLVTAWAAGGLAASARPGGVAAVAGACGCRRPPPGSPRRTCLAWPGSSSRHTCRTADAERARAIRRGSARDRCGVRDLDRRWRPPRGGGRGASTDGCGSSLSTSGRATRRWWSFPTAPGGSSMPAACPGR